MSRTGGQGRSTFPFPLTPPAPPAPPAPRERRRGRWWRWPATALILLVEGIMLLFIIGGGALAWRAAQGPVDVSWLLPRLSRVIAVAAPGLDVSIGHFAIAWKGFTNGPDQPIRLTGDAIRVVEVKRHRSIAVAHASAELSAAWAVRGVLAPRVVVLVNPVLVLRRPLQGTSVSPSSMSARDVVHVLARPPETDKQLVREKPAALSELRRLTLSNGTVLIEPAGGRAGQGAKTLRAGNIAAEVTRAAAGGLTGQFSAVLSTLVAGQPAQSDPKNFAQTPTVSAAVAIGTTGAVHVQAQGKVDDPAALMAALAPPAGTPIPAMPLQATADVTTDADLNLTALKARLTGGAGQVAMGGAAIPVSGLVLSASGSGDRITIDPGSHIAFAAVSQQAPPTVTLGGSAERSATGLAATVSLGIDHVASDDVAAYWPPSIAHGAYTWIKSQVHGGLLHDGLFRIGFKSGPDLTDFAISSAGGAVAATGLAIAWLPPLPPLTDVHGTIALTGPGSVGVTVSKASQGNLSVTNSTMVITGLSAREQTGTIALYAAGPVASALALLSHPRLNLMKSVPFPLNATAGTVATVVNLSLPLNANVTFAQINVKVHAGIQNLALANILLGRSVTGGALTIDANPSTLHLTGTAALAAIPTQLALDANFAKGPPGQVVVRLTATATADQTALAKAGIPTAGVLNGSVQAKVDVSAERSGRTDIDAKLTLPESHLRITPISWTGGAGEATATAHVALQNGTIVALDDLSLKGPDVGLQATSTFNGGRLSKLTVDRIVLGRTDLHGSFSLPAAASDPYVLDVAGPALDLSGIWGGGHASAPSVAPANTALSSISSKTEFAPHPPWRARVDIDRVIFGRMASGATRELDHLRGLAVNNGVVVESAQIGFEVEPSHSAAHLSIVPEVGGSRNVTLTSGDFGGLLKATNAYDAVTGGELRIDATYDDRLPEHPLSGTAEMDKFTLGDAPTAAKLLAAMTLYGVVDLLHGKGLFFSKLLAPFTLADRRLVLSQARAYSASLGLTAHGSVDLPRNQFDVQGTIVPAYFFNSLLGHIPFIGKLFSPEKGGGVFAAKYQLVGPIDNPQVHVNPLSLITPGFLRGLFQ